MGWQDDDIVSGWETDPVETPKKGGFISALASAPKRFAKGLVSGYAKATMLPATGLAKIGIGSEEDLQKRKATAETGGEGIAGKAGELAFDLAVTAIPVAKGAKGGLTLLETTLPKVGPVARGVAAQGGAGAASGIVHQAQDVGMGEAPSLKEAALESGLSAFVGGAGPKIGQTLSDWAPQRMIRILNPAKGQGIGMSKNPITEEKVSKAMQLTGRQNSLEEFRDNLSKGYQEIAQKRDALLDQSGLGFHSGSAVKQARDEIMQRAKDYKLDGNDARRALEYLKSKPSKVVSGVEARNLKTTAAKHGKFKPGEDGYPRQIAEEIYSNKMRGIIRQTMDKTPYANQFRMLETDLADIKPVLEAVVDRAAKPAQAIEAPWWTQLGAFSGLMGAGGVAGGVASGNPELIAGGLGAAAFPFVYGATKGPKPPMMAAQAGRSLLNPSDKRDILMQLMRSESQVGATPDILMQLLGVPK